MRVVIRADASPSMGTGHLMRCLALAQALRDAGDQVTLASRVLPGDPLLDAWSLEGIEMKPIAAPAGGGEDANSTREIVTSVAASWLVVDGYHFDTRFRSAAAGPARLAWIDDHGLKAATADLIVNGNLYASEQLYPESSARLAVGPRHALLRREFRALRPKDAHRSGVVLSLGGADPESRSGPLMRALAARGIRGQLVVGPHNRSRDALRAEAPGLGWTVIDAPRNMAPLLGSCRLAVVAAGTTTLELLALATPMVAVRIAENQRLVAAALDRLDLAAVTDGADPESVAARTEWLLEDARSRDSMAQRARGVVDGRGALRVMGEMRGALLVLRAATMGDSQLLLDWRNDPDTRLASFQTEEVSPTDHREWMAASLASGSRHLLIGELESRPIGVIRLDVAGGEAVISITIAPEARGSGLAAPMLRKALQQAAQLGLSRVEARIRSENDASIRAFSAAGFEESGPRRMASGEVKMFAAPEVRGIMDR